MNIRIDTPAAPEPLGYDGRMGDFIGLAIGNLLLTIITLGIYRFWAKTRVRRYLWQHTSFRGEPLEYRGRGIEKFLGALIVFAVVIVPLLIVSGIAAVAMSQKAFGLVALFYAALYIALIYLLGVGIYRSQRYMFSRTAWRGIRGGMIAGGWRYGGLFLRMLLLQIVSFGFASPYIATRLWNARMNDAMFGSAKVTATAEWRPVYRRFLIAWFGALAIYIVAIAIIAVSMGPQLAALTPGAPPPADPTAMMAVVAKAYGIALLAAIAIAMLMLSYHAALLRELFGKTQLSALGFRFDATAADLLKFALGNLALIFLTLGLGLVLMPFRIWTFYVRHLATVSDVDVDALMQSSLAMPVQGDGLADAFDTSAF